MTRWEQARLWLAAALLAFSAGALAARPLLAMSTIQWLAERVADAQLTQQGAGAIIVALAAGQAALALWLIASRGACAARVATFALMLALTPALLYLIGWGRESGCGCLDGLGFFGEARRNAGAGLTRAAAVMALMAPGNEAGRCPTAEPLC